MVDVTEKAATRRTAVAAGSLHTSAEVVALISCGACNDSMTSRERM